MATNDTEVGVVFSGDASGAVAGAATVRTSIQGISPDVKALADSMAALTATVKAGFEQMAAASSALGAQIKHDAEEEEGALLGLLNSTHEVVEGFIELKEAATGIGEALMALFAVEAIIEFAKQMGEAGEKTTHLSETLGMSVGEVQGLGAMALGAGFSIDTLTKGMEKLDRSFQAGADGNAKMANALAEIGISTDKTYTQTELLSTAMEGFSKMADGPAKVALAMQLFGKAGAALIPFLNQGAEGAAKLTEEIDKYGAVNENAVAQATALAESQNEQNVAMQGFGNIMSESLAPSFKIMTDGFNDLIKGFIDSYDAGGPMKTLMDDIAIVMKALQTVFIIVGAVISDAWSIVDATIKFTFQNIVSVAEYLWSQMGATKAMFTEFASSVQTDMADFTTFVSTAFQSAVNFIKPFWDWLVQVAQGMGKFINSIPGVSGAMKVAGDALQTVGNQSKAIMQGVVADATAAATAVAKVWGQDAKPEEKPKKPTGTTGGDESGKPHQDDTSAVDRQKQAFLDIENANHTSLQNRAADEAAFWATVKTDTDGSALNAESALKIKQMLSQQEHDQAMAAINETLAADKAAAAQTVATANDTYKQKATLVTAQIKDTEDAAKRGEISDQAGHDKVIQLLNDERQAALARDNAILTSRLLLDSQIEASNKANTDAFKAAKLDEQAAQTAFNSAEVAANDNKNKQIATADRVLHDQQLAGWTQMTNSIVTTFGTGLRGMMQGTMTFQQVVLNVWNSLLDIVFKVVEQMVEKWLTGLIMQQVAQHTTGAATAVAGVTQEAAVAGAAMTASMAADPLTAPFALEMGMAEASGVESFFGGMAGFAGGHPNVPFDGIAKIHTGETILPASIAQPMRAMIAANGNAMSGGGAASSNGSGGGGDTYQIAVSALDAKSIDTFMRGSGGDAIVKGLVAKRRQNAGASAQ